MITIGYDETRCELVAHIDGPFPVSNSVFSLRWNAGSAWAAKLLAYAIRDGMDRRLAAIRREAYAQGWKDAKAKRHGKRDWFSAGWELES